MRRMKRGCPVVEGGECWWLMSQWGMAFLVSTNLLQNVANDGFKGEDKMLALGGCVIAAKLTNCSAGGHLGGRRQHLPFVVKLLHAVHQSEGSSDVAICGTRNQGKGPPVTWRMRMEGVMAIPPTGKDTHWWLFKCSTLFTKDLDIL
jgi:hypothetical protein